MLIPIGMLGSAAITGPAKGFVPPAQDGRFRPHNTDVVRTIARGFHTFCLRMLAWQMRRMNRTILSSLDERSLHDIGLHRSGIEAAVRDIRAARRKRAAIRRFRQGAFPGGPQQPATVRGG